MKKELEQLSRHLNVQGKLNHLEMLKQIGEEPSGDLPVGSFNQLLFSDSGSGFDIEWQGSHYGFTSHSRSEFP